MMSLRGRSERRPYAKNVTGHHFETGPDADSTGDSFVVSLLEMTRLANRTKKSARA